jgi:hypothetical protein
MTAGGDTDEFEDAQILDESDDVGDETADVDLNESDPDPTAGASDIGGRAGDDFDPTAPIDVGEPAPDDQQGAGGGQTGTGQGPTGS